MVDSAYKVLKDLANEICPIRKKILKTGKSAIRNSPRIVILESDLFAKYNLYKSMGYDNKSIRLQPDYKLIEKQIKKEHTEERKKSPDKIDRQFGY